MADVFADPELNQSGNSCLLIGLNGFVIKKFYALLPFVVPIAYGALP